MCVCVHVYASECISEGQGVCVCVHMENNSFCMLLMSAGTHNMCYVSILYSESLSTLGCSIV